MGRFPAYLALGLALSTTPASSQSCDPELDCFDLCREAGQLADSIPYPEGDQSNCQHAALIRGAWSACEAVLNAPIDQNAYDWANWSLGRIQDYSDNKCKAQ